MDMISEYIKKIELKIKKSKSNRKLRENKYWKLPATERLHYDSLNDKIKADHFGLLTLTFVWIKISVFIPAFMVIAALFTNQMETIVPLAQGIFLKLIASTIIIFKLDLLQFLTFHLWIIPRNTERLNKRFRLIK